MFRHLTLALAATLLPSAAHAASVLHGAAMGWPWALPFAGIFVCIIPVLAMLEAGHWPFAWLLQAVTAHDGSPHEVAYF
jgi:putative citrate transport